MVTHMTSLTIVYNNFFDSVLTPKIVVTTVPKKDLMIVLPHLGKLSLQIRTIFNNVMKNKLPYCNFGLYSGLSSSENSCFLSFWHCL